MRIMNQSLSKFRAALDESRTDSQWVFEQEARNQKRVGVQREIADLVKRFLSGEVSTADFRRIFHQKNTKEWDVFGLKGLSGGMFLNKLVKHVPDQDLLARALKKVILVPSDPARAQTEMNEFVSYLNGLIANRLVSKLQLQPARAPFFVSSLWHMQDKDAWPIYYSSARTVFEEAGIYSPSGDPVSDYFKFREAWLELREQLSVPVWNLENLFSRINKVGETVVPSEAALPDEDDGQGTSIEVPAEELSLHTEVQWMLAKLGHKFGYRVWIAGNDRSKRWKGETLGGLSLQTLPNLGIGGEAQRIIRLIDVLWLRESHQVVAAFEVESTTSIYSGLLRMSDLVITCPNLTFDCFIAVPQARASDVVRQLSRPTFQDLELHKKCSFFTFEDLRSELNSIMRWAKDSRSMRTLAKSVDDVSYDNSDDR